MPVNKYLMAGIGTAIALAAGAITGCGSEVHEDVAYAPSAYGEQNHCYYVQDINEAYALQNAGLCPRTWQPMLMPVIWHARYAAFYDAPVYYNSYVPVRTRTLYVTKVKTFERTNASRINSEVSKATWKGTDNKQYSGAAVQQRVKSGEASFSSGKLRSGGFSGGSLRDPNRSVKRDNSVNQGNNRSYNKPDRNLNKSRSDSGFSSGNRSRSNSNSGGSGRRR